MERAVQRSFEPIHSYTTRETGGSSYGENTIASKENHLSLQKLRAHEAASCDKIRLQMLKTMNIEIPLCIICVCHAAGRSRRATEDWQTGMITPYTRREIGGKGNLNTEAFSSQPP